MRQVGASGLFVVLADGRGGAEVDLVRMREWRTASVVHRTRTRTWFAAILPDVAPSAFVLPRNGTSAGALRVVDERLRWTRLTSGRVSSPDYMVFGHAPDGEGPPFWLSATAFSTNIGLALTEVERGRARRLTLSESSISDVQAVGAWRRGDRFWAVDTAGTTYRLRPKTGEAEWASGVRSLGYLGAFSACRRAPLAVAVGDGRALLLRVHGEGWSPLDSCPIPKGEATYLPHLEVDGRGRWAAIVGYDGTATLLKVEGGRTIRPAASIARFVDRTETFAAPFALVEGLPSEG